MRWQKTGGQGINSHIQMPKCVLKRFENKNNNFYYYDVRKGFIGSNGHAKSLNTELGYYSANTEAFLNKNVEKPFSDLLQKIDKIDFSSPSFDMTTEMDGVVKRFIYSLVVRSPQMIEATNRNSVFYQFLPLQEQHDYAVEAGLFFADNSGLLDDYFVTFAVNRSQTPFVLPMCGLYNFKINKIGTAFLPISPELSIALVKNNGKELMIKNNMIAMFLITDRNQATRFNKRAFAAQVSAGYGYVISSDKTALEACLND